MKMAEVKHPSLNEALLDSGMNEIAARILLAAMNLFSEKGYAATSVREIVQEAKVTNPMLYYYFDSKEGVFMELIAFLFSSMNQYMGEVLGKDHSLEQRLRAVACAHHEACRETPEVLRFIYSVLFGPAESSPRVDMFSLINKHHEQVREAFEKAIKKGEFEPYPGFDPHYLTELFMGLISNQMIGVLTVYDHFRDHPDYEEMLQAYLSENALDRVITFFFRGAGKIT